jgi:hypothetical protein
MTRQARCDASRTPLPVGDRAIDSGAKPICDGGWAGAPKSSPAGRGRRALRQTTWRGTARLHPVETASYESYERLEGDVIVANITRPILEVAISRMDAPTLVLSGLLVEEVDDFAEILPPGFRVRETWTSGEWAALVITMVPQSEDERERRLCSDFTGNREVSEEAHHRRSPATTRRGGGALRRGRRGLGESNESRVLGRARILARIAEPPLHPRRLG